MRGACTRCKSGPPKKNCILMRTDLRPLRRQDDGCRALDPCLCECKEIVPSGEAPRQISLMLQREQSFLRDGPVPRIPAVHCVARPTRVASSELGGTKIEQPDLFLPCERRCTAESIRRTLPQCGGCSGACAPRRGRGRGASGASQVAGEEQLLVPGDEHLVLSLRIGPTFVMPPAPRERASEAQRIPCHRPEARSARGVTSRL